ncbi:MAG TPA: hypothetical protein VGE07_31535 [Herpetosiphonaceae bacterium]
MARRFVLFCLLACLLAACGGGATDLPTSAPPLPGPDNVPENQPQPTVIAENPIDVPGKLLFVNSGDIWVASGKNASRLTSSGKKRQPAWSSDGKQIAYIQREESFADIWVMDADGGGKQPITDNEPPNIGARSPEHVQSITWAFYPAWSPDGTWITYVSQKQPPVGSAMDSLEEYPLSLYLYRTRRIAEGVTGGPANELFFYGDGFSDLSHPTWAPDSSLIVYAAANRQSRALELGYYNLETEQYGALEGPDAATFAGALAPAWSPDGDWLAYVRRENGQSDIWVVAAPGPDGETRGQPRKLTTTGNAANPVWSPDGKHMAFFIAKEGTIFLVIADVTAGGAPALENIRDIHKGAIDVDSGMSWTK